MCVCVRVCVCVCVCVCDVIPWMSILHFGVGEDCRGGSARVAARGAKLIVNMVLKREGLHGAI